MAMSAPTVEAILNRAKTYNPSLNCERVRRAFQFAEEAHKGQTRFSGEPYIIHPLGVTWILLDFHPDEDTLVTALLHDVAEDTNRTLEDIGKVFGPNVEHLCWGMVKLSKVRSKLNDPQVDNLRKLFLAMAKDFRVVLLKLCDRLHNMRTLDFVRPEKRERIAQETINIFSPIAGRLGIYRLKSQLEDLCFMYLKPDEHQSIKQELVQTEKWREKYIENAQKILLDTFAREGIQAAVDGRVKGMYSIFRKLQKKNKSSVQEVFDIFAMRIILPDIYKYGKEYTGHLYTALGVLHNHFTPLANRFKDYVAVPKVNGYRSLHTTVMGLGPKVHTQPTEVQIRTNSMHEYAEFGIAAHWLYEEGKETGISDIGIPPTLKAATAVTVAPFLKQQKDWISGLKKVEEEIESNRELMEHLSVDFFSDRIFVLTPRGDVKDLPVAATPVDFAYAVHTEIGNHCIGAKVNASVVPLDYELKNGEVVEIVTRKNANPSQQWMAFVKTTHARNRIRAWFKNLDEDKHMKDGRVLLNKKLAQLGQPPLDEHLTILRKYDGNNLSLRERQEVLRDIGSGGVLPSAVLKKIFPVEELLMGRKLGHLSREGPPRRSRKILEAAKAEQVKDKPKVLIGGEENVPHQFVQCCDASLADSLVGYVTRGKGISIHKSDCKTLRDIEEARLIPVHVSGAYPKYPVAVSVSVVDRMGLIRDLSQLITSQKINILDISQGTPKNGHIELHFILEIEQFDQLDRVLSNLENIPNVLRACKMNS